MNMHHTRVHVLTYACVYTLWRTAHARRRRKKGIEEMEGDERKRARLSAAWQGIMSACLLNRLLSSCSLLLCFYVLWTWHRKYKTAMQAITMQKWLGENSSQIVASSVTVNDEEIQNFLRYSLREGFQVDDMNLSKKIIVIKFACAYPIVKDMINICNTYHSQHTFPSFILFI